jgi:hypothetical protein
VTEPIEADDLPGGAIAMALTIVETQLGRGVGGGKTNLERLGEAIRLGVEVWGENSLVNAFGILIYIGVSLAKDKIELGDLLQTMVPAIVGGLHEEAEQLDVPVEMVPTAAGLLTAAYLGRMPYEWRTGLGPIGPGEPMMFCYTACGVAQYMDDNVYGRPGRFAEVLTMGLATDRP